MFTKIDEMLPDEKKNALPNRSYKCVGDIYFTILMEKDKNDRKNTAKTLNRPEYHFYIHFKMN